jgi:hypothetical protein
MKKKNKPATPITTETTGGMIELKPTESFITHVVKCEEALDNNCLLSVHPENDDVNSWTCLYTYLGDRRTKVTVEWIIAQLSNMVVAKDTQWDWDRLDYELCTYEYLHSIATAIIKRVPAHCEEWKMFGHLARSDWHKP